MTDRIFTAEDIDNYDDEELEKLFCPKCRAVGIKSILGAKILLPNEVKQPDYEDWLQCSKCTFLCPIYEAPKDETVKDTVETIDNPFDNKFKLESIPKRNSPKGKKLSEKKKRDKIKSTEDKEIELAIKQHGKDNVRIIQ